VDCTAAVIGTTMTCCATWMNWVQCLVNDIGKPTCLLMAQHVLLILLWWLLLSPILTSTSTSQWMIAMMIMVMMKRDGCEPGRIHSCCCWVTLAVTMMGGFCCSPSHSCSSSSSSLLHWLCLVDHMLCELHHPLWSWAWLHKHRDMASQSSWKEQKWQTESTCSSSWRRKMHAQSPFYFGYIHHKITKIMGGLLFISCRQAFEHPHPHSGAHQRIYDHN